jgi:hypothetical protein
MRRASVEKKKPHRKDFLQAKCLRAGWLSECQREYSKPTAFAEFFPNGARLPERGVQDATGSSRLSLAVSQLSFVV